MLISWKDGQFIARATIREGKLLNSWGWRWSPKIQRWIIQSPEVAAKFGDALAPSALAAIDLHRKRQERAVALSYAVEADGYEVPLSDTVRERGWDFKGFQKAGVRYAVPRSKVLIADEPGLGKTISAIGKVNALGGDGRNLVIPMAAHRVNWEREIRTWAAGPTDVNVISPENLKFDPGYPWTVLSYNYLREFYGEIEPYHFDNVIADEAHYIRNVDANRTKYLIGGGSGRTAVRSLDAANWTFLTGTPIDHRPSDMWTLCRFCDPEGLGARMDHYMLRYCGGHVDQFMRIADAKGKGNLEELQRLARAAFMVRRMKADVMKELPPKQRQVVLLPQSRLKTKIDKEQTRVQSALEAYERMLGEHNEDIADTAIDFSRRIHDEILEIDGSFEDVVSQLGDFSLKDIAEAIATARRELAEAKIPMILEHVKALLDAGEKVLVLGYHRSVVRALRDALADYGVADLSVPPMRRQAQVDRFQDDPECRVAVGNILAAGTGYTMTRATVVVFAELSWSPSDLLQGEDRGHRIGLDHSLLVHYLIVEGSLEAYMVFRLIIKMEIAERSLNKNRLTQG